MSDAVDLVRLLPTAIYLDTSVLEELPETLESGELAGLVAQAGKLEIPVLVPDIVAKEWLWHRGDKALTSLRNAQTGLRHVASYLPGTACPNIDEKVLVEAVWKAARERLARTGLQSLPAPSVDVPELTVRALANVPPLRKGFKDELVVLSIEQDMARRDPKGAAVLVARDKHFGDPEVLARFDARGGKLVVVGRLEDASKIVKDALNDVLRAVFAKWETSARKAAEGAATKLGDKADLLSAIMDKIARGEITSDELAAFAG